jgi:hypothetical protein
LLRNIYDLERITGRVGAGTANARDVLGLAESLVRLSDLAVLAQQGTSPYLKALQNVPPDLEQLGQYVIAHLVESPPLHLKEGGIIREGIHAKLDEIRQTIEGDRQWLANLEVDEREKTGISNLKVGYSKAFGYYLSMPRSKADRVPPHYLRKQTLTNEELVQEKYQGIRPAPGYPACPDHTLKPQIWELMAVEKNTGNKLTESYAMYPTASVSGFYFASPHGKYFGVGKIQKDQVEALAEAKGLPFAEMERWLGSNIAY